MLTADLYPAKSFDEELYICGTCYKHFYKNEIPYQAVCNEMVLDPRQHDEYMHLTLS